MSNILDSHLAAYEGQNLYDFDNEILLTWYPKRIISSSKKGDTLLELGLGHGFTTNIFSTFFDRHVVLDGSAAVISHYKTKHPESKAEIVETYFENYETDEQFDLIVMGFVLEHVDNPVQIMERFRKFLKPGGKMYVSVPNAEVMNRRLGNLAGDLDDMKAMAPNDILLGQQRYYTVKTLEEDIAEAGYKVVLMEGIYLKPFATRQMVSLGLPERYIDALCELAVHYPELSCGLMAQIQ